MRVLLTVIFGLLLVSLGQDNQQQASQQQETQEQPEESSSQDAQPSQSTTAPSESTANLNLPKLTINRKDRKIIVSQTAPGNKGGKSKLNADRCDTNNEALIFNTFFAPSPFFIETEVNEAILTSNIAISRQPPNKKDADGNTVENGNDKAILELYGGTVEFIEDRKNEQYNCPINIKSSDKADVTLKEGRTTVTGINFIYDNNTGIGTMKGPITLDRVAEGDSPALNATSDSLETNVDEDKTYLTGNVKVTSEDRVSEATTLEYNEEEGLAILRGDEDTPAKSTKGSDVLQGDVIIYYLDTNDVVVQGNLQGDIEVDLEDEPSNNGDSTTSDEPATDSGNEE